MTNALTASLVSGDSAAFDQLYQDNHQSLIYMLVRKGMSYTDAEDVAQEAFMRIARHAAQLDVTKSVVGLLRVTAQRIMIDRHRKAQRSVRESLVDLNDTECSLVAREDQIESEVDATETVAMAMAVLDEQEDLTKQVVRMYYFENQTYKQIAEQLGIGVTTAKDRLRNALGVIRQRVAIEE